MSSGDRGGDVVDRPDVAVERAVAATKSHGATGEPDNRTVGPQRSELEVQVRPRLDSRLPRFGDTNAIVGVDRRDPATAEDSLRGHRGVLAPSIVDVVAVAGRIGLEDADGGPGDRPIARRNDAEHGG